MLLQATATTLGMQKCCLKGVSKPRLMNMVGRHLPKGRTLQHKKQKPQRKKEELLNAVVCCNKKGTQIMSGMALYPRHNSIFSFQIRVRI